MCKLNSIVMTKDCSRKKKIRILPLQEFVNPSSKAEMEITKFHSLLICKSPHLNGKASFESHKASARVFCVVTTEVRVCWGWQRTGDTLQGGSQGAPASLNQVTKEHVQS